jgi:hypothetical protein
MPNRQPLLEPPNPLDPKPLDPKPLLPKPLLPPAPLELPPEQIPFAQVPPDCVQSTQAPPPLPHVVSPPEWQVPP